MILHVEPIPYICASTVHRYRRTSERVPNHRWNQLLCVLPSSIIVRAIGDDHGNAVCLMPCPHKMVGSSLAGGVRRIRHVSTTGIEQPALGECTEHLIG